MAAADPFAPLRDWRLSLFRGEPAAIDRFLDGLDATPAPGWVRDRNYERLRPHSDRIRCYLFDRAGDAAVRVWLQRVTATRVRGGPVEVLRHLPSGNAGRIAQLVADFADNCVMPAARAAGIRFTRPAFGPLSVLNHAAETQFIKFADRIDGEWPLADRSEELWYDLLSTCLTEQVGIDRAELTQWLVGSGWEGEAVTALVGRFFADSEWLAKRLAVLNA